MIAGDGAALTQLSSEETPSSVNRLAAAETASARGARTTAAPERADQQERPESPHRRQLRQRARQLAQEHRSAGARDPDSPDRLVKETWRALDQARRAMESAAARGHVGEVPETPDRARVWFLENWRMVRQQLRAIRRDLARRRARPLPSSPADRK